MIKKRTLTALFCIVSILPSYSIDVANVAQLTSAINSIGTGSGDIRAIADFTISSNIPQVAGGINFSGDNQTTYRIITLQNSNRRFNMAGSGKSSSFSFLELTGATGGAIVNNAQNITVSSSILRLNSSSANGGAIANNAAGLNLDIFNTQIISNNANNGGGIYNLGNLTLNNGTLLQSNVASNNGGGVRTDNATLTTNDDVTFQSNQAVNGGAIYGNNSTITINDGAEFISNTAANAGGAIRNDGVSSSLTVNGAEFTSNNAAQGGAIYTIGTTNINQGSSFDTNTATTNGGAIYNAGTTLNINGTTFSGNTASSSGGAVFNQNASSITTVAESTFTGNSAGTGGAMINNSGTLTLNSGNTFDSNSATTGGAIANMGTASVLTIKGGNTFTNNTSSLGGALHVNGGATNLTSDANGDIVFSNNREAGNLNDIRNNANGAAAININGTEGSVALNSGISGTGIVNKTNAGQLVLGANSINNNYTGQYNQTGGTLTNYSVSFLGGVNTVSNSNINLLQTQNLTINNLSINNVNVDSINNTPTNTTINNFHLGAAGANFNVDVKAIGTSDTFTFNQGTYGPSSGVINVSRINLLGSPTAQIIPMQIFNNLTGAAYTTTVGPIETPIFNYDFQSNGGGLFSLLQTGYNKKVFRGQVATMAAYNNQLTVNNSLFDHVYLDSEAQTLANRNPNKYASVLFAPYQYSREDGSVWFKSYTSIETLAMTQDLNIDNTAYGSIVGVDLPVVKLKRGWSFLPTAYVSYNGGHQTYSGVSMYQNGGQGGLMGTFMRKDFIASILAYGGGYGNKMYVDGTASINGATDNTGNWFAGTATKMAYNFHPTRNLIVQPTALVSYNIFGQQTWGSDFGAISMNSGYLNGINVAPGLNVIYGRDTWSVYGLTQYMYNINDKLDGTAGSVSLPDLKMRHGFIEYGFGATKTWKERLMSYAQFTVRNAGRTGVNFQLGFSWKL